MFCETLSIPLIRTSQTQHHTKFRRISFTHLRVSMLSDLVSGEEDSGLNITQIRISRISDNSISIPNHSSKFEFNQILNENCKISEVYEARTKDTVSAAVRGFNGTGFAYGQTISGKTHTMCGSKATPGVIPGDVHDLFQILEQAFGQQ